MSVDDNDVMDEGRLSNGSVGTVDDVDDNMGVDHFVLYDWAEIEDYTSANNQGGIFIRTSHAPRPILFRGTLALGVIINVIS
eukprot:991262-Amorphochlora_amoeboformis.AAC.1